MPHAEKYLLAGVMGFPIMHSRSPAIHNYWLAEYGMLGHYAPLAVKPEGLEKALRALHPLGCAGGGSVSCAVVRTICGDTGQRVFHERTAICAAHQYGPCRKA